MIGFDYFWTIGNAVRQRFTHGVKKCEHLLTANDYDIVAEAEAILRDAAAAELVPA